MKIIQLMPTVDPAIRAYLARLRTILQYSEHEGISITQVYRRIEEGRADVEVIGGKKFIVLPEPPEEAQQAA